MKKSLALLAVAAMLVGTTGCGSCRGLFCKRAPRVATPVYSQCAPTCAPTCCPTGDSCGCETGTPVTSGYLGDGEVMLSPSATYEAPAMTYPTGSGTFGQ